MTFALGPAFRRGLHVLWRLALAGVLVVAVAAGGFWWYASGLTVPAVLLADERSSVLVQDRGGQLLARVRRDEMHSLPITRGDIHKHLIDTLLAAEDKRFYTHPGVDPIAVLRAALQALRAGRVVSGASTLTQQLARSTFERPRTVSGKLHEMALALRIEAALDKDVILVAYLNRVPFGGNLQGVGAAAQAYFAKPVRALSLSEAATLVAIPRGPSLYDPRRQPALVKRRRDRILHRLAEQRPELAKDAQRAIEMPVVLQQQLVWPGAFHWVRRLARQEPAAVVRTTLDGALQRRVEAHVRAAIPDTNAGVAAAAAVLVVDNRTREVLAYVGSPRYYADEQAGGQNDGVVALRQPGSTLKPFVYASAMRRLGYTASTLLPDIPLEFRERGQVYAPRNYDGRFHGPVRLRVALGNSLNVPAVHTAALVGVQPLLEDLRSFGFDSLTREPEHYGVAIALGNGEVRLEELVAAYVSLARGGKYAPLRFALSQDVTPERVVVSQPIAGIIADILKDPHARAGAFGRHGALEFDYPVAVKTGTSKAGRDNWTLGFSDSVTVGVWVGNFDGKPTVGGSGASAAAPLFYAVMSDAHAHKGNARLTSARGDGFGIDDPAGAVAVTVCAHSGLLPNEHCPTTVREWFVPGTEPRRIDELHVERPVFGGALAPQCAAATRQVFESYAPQYARWAAESGRPTLPTTTLAGCATPSADASPSVPRITYPRAGAVYRRVPGEPSSRQALVFQASAAGARQVTYVVDARPFRTVEPPFDTVWALQPGTHAVYVVTDDGTRSPAVSFRVE